MKLRVVHCFIAALIFSGCQSQPQGLYSWGSYETQVYSFLNNADPHPQIEKMESELQEMDGNVPPGFFAHLGYLHAETDNREKAVSYFNEEKTRFPESAVFMNFILQRLLPAN